MKTATLSLLVAWILAVVAVAAPADDLESSAISSEASAPISDRLSSGDPFGEPILPPPPDAAARVISDSASAGFSGAALVLGGNGGWSSGDPFGLNTTGQAFYYRGLDPNLDGFSRVLIWSPLGYAPVPPEALAYRNDRLPAKEGGSMIAYPRLSWSPGLFPSRCNRAKTTLSDAEIVATAAGMVERLRSFVRSCHDRGIRVSLYMGPPCLVDDARLRWEATTARDLLGVDGEYCDALSWEPDTARQARIMDTLETIYGSRLYIGCESWRVSPEVRAQYPAAQLVLRPGGDDHSANRPNDSEDLVRFARLRLASWRNYAGEFRPGDDYGREWFRPEVILWPTSAEPTSPASETNARLRFRWSTWRYIYIP